jgi:hypothetical protein
MAFAAFSNRLKKDALRERAAVEDAPGGIGHVTVHVDPVDAATLGLGEGEDELRAADLHGPPVPNRTASERWIPVAERRRTTSASSWGRAVTIFASCSRVMAFERVH